MVRKWLSALVAVVAMVSLGGIGFAAFTSSATITTTATAGSFTLVWTAASAVPNCAPNTCGGGSPPETCFTGGTPTSALAVSITNFNSGDTCILTATLTNMGTLPGLLNPASWNILPDFTITPNSPGFPANPIAAGGSITSTWTFTAVSSSSDVFMLTVSGTAT